MKRLLTVLFSLMFLTSMAQVPVLTATVSGQVMLEGTNIPVPGHSINFFMHSSDSTGSSLTGEAFTDENGQYNFTESIEGTSGTLSLQTKTCNGIQIETMPLVSDSVNRFHLNFYTCVSYDCQADFTYSVPDELTCQFMDQSQTAPGHNIEYYWSFGDGHSVHEQNPVHTYAEPGIYNVCLTISTLDSSCFSSYCESVIVGATSNCLAQFSWFPDTLNSSYGVQFMDLSYGNPTNWSWSFGDSIGSSEQNPAHEYGAPGVYHVCLTVTGPECQSTWCAEVNIEEILPDCFNYFTFVTAGKTIEFTGFHSSSPTVDYQWDFGDGITSEGNPAMHTYENSGVYFVTLKSWDASMCIATSSQQVVIGDTIAYNQVYGQVFEDNWPLANGFVMIFSVESDTNYLPYYDMATVDNNGVYVFPMVPNGNYNILAIPTDGSNYLPTYYESTLFWQEANVVTAGQTSNPVNIQLLKVQGYANPGLGNISGLINQTGAPNAFLEKIVIYLTDSEHHILDFTQVDADGTFAFNNLAFGKYYLKPELAGVISEYQLVTLSETQSAASISMTFTGNSILGKPEGISSVTDVTIYPNPVKETIRIIVNQLNNGAVRISLNDLSGRSIINQTSSVSAGIAKIDLNVNDLKPGIYILELVFEDGSRLSRKLIKN
ncbi:MAG: PKD domain-containing protein [Lentimicrobiaceae bacterium]